MNTVTKVLSRVLVKEFYQANAGAFLIGAGLLFGFLKAPQHQDIAMALASNPIYYTVPLALWVLYGIKTILFCIRIKKLPANQFITDSCLLNTFQRSLTALHLQALLLIPVLGYSVLLFTAAFQSGAYQSAALVVVGNLLVLVIFAYFLCINLMKPVDAKSNNRWFLWTRKLPKRMSTLYIHHLFHRQALPLLLTKLVSLSILLGASILCESSDHDLRLLSLGVLLAAGVNSGLGFRHMIFNTERLPIFQNLPIPFSKKIIDNALTYTFLILPEIIVLYSQNMLQADIFHLLKLTIMLWSIMQFYHSVALLKGMDMDLFIRYPFLITAALFFVLLGFIDPLIIAGLFTTVSIILFRRFMGPRDSYRGA